MILRSVFQSESWAFLSNVMLNSCLISSNVVNRSIWTKSNHSRYVGTNWLHLGALLTILRGHFAYCISTPYVMYRNGAKGWKDNYSVHLENSVALSEILNELSITDYSRTSVNKVLKVITRSLPSIIHSAKDNGFPINILTFKRMVSQFKSMPFFWVVCIPLILLPSVLHRIVLKRIKMIKRTVLTKRALNNSIEG